MLTRARRWRRAAGDRGSMSVELVVVAPGLVLLLLLLAAGGRVVEVQSQIDGAARDAARAASLGETAGQAQAFARQAAAGDLGATCSPASDARIMSRWPAAPVPVGAVVPENSVTVRVTCHVDMAPYSILGFSPSYLFTGTAVAPLDPFVCRESPGVTC